jgi:hypothetical protein
MSEVKIFVLSQLSVVRRRQVQFYASEKKIAMKHSMLALLSRVIQTCTSHKWLLLVCLIATITYVMVSPAIVYPPPNSARNLVYEQGWPMVYTIRVSDLGWGENRWGTNSALWFIFEGVQYFYIWPLFVDIAIALGLSLSVVFLWHQHCIANQKPWLINVREAMIVTLTVAFVLIAILVAIKTLRHKHDKEMAFLAELEKTGWGLRCSSDALPWYLRPLNDLCIIREQDYDYSGLEWPGNLNHIGSPEELEKETENINDTLVRLSSEKTPLSFVHSVVIADQRLDARGIKALCKLFPCCTELYISGFLKDSLHHITDVEVAFLTGHLRNLHTLGLYGAKLTDESVRLLATMHKLNYLAFDDREKMTTNANLKSLLALPHIHCLGIPAHWAITNEEKETIMRYGPSVDFITPEK